MLFKECVEKNPEMPEGYVGLGRIAMERKDYQGAMTAFDKALSLGSENPQAILYGGMLRLRTGKAAEAIAPLRKAVQLRPTLSWARGCLGQALATAGTPTELDEAVQHLDRARALDAGDPDYSFWEGIAHLKAGRDKAAYRAFLRIRATGQSYPDLDLWLAFAQASNRDTEDALATLANVPERTYAAALRDQIKAGKPLPAIAFDENGAIYLDFEKEFQATPPPPKPVDPKAKRGGKDGKDAKDGKRQP
jgi:tetratricopeptide (TPR) repeat protein